MPQFALEQLQFAPRFDAAACQQQLSTAELGSTLLSAAALPSTQTLLQNNARLFPNGTVCIADTQHQGKGALCRRTPSCAFGGRLLLGILWIEDEI